MAKDFRHILPVVLRRTKAGELASSIKTSYRWQHVSVLKQQNCVCLYIEISLQQNFSLKLLEIGKNKTSVDPQDGLHILPCETMVSCLKELKHNVFLNICHHYGDSDWLCKREISAPSNIECGQTQWGSNYSISRDSITIQIHRLSTRSTPSG